MINEQRGNRKVISPCRPKLYRILGTVDENGIPQLKAMIKTAAIGIKEFWNDGMKMYYPLGCTDPDFALIKFTASKGNYYHGLKNVDFDI